MYQSSINGCSTFLTSHHTGIRESLDEGTYIIIPSKIRAEKAFNCYRITNVYSIPELNKKVIETIGEPMLVYSSESDEINIKTGIAN
jgi:hypothetical protein